MERKFLANGIGWNGNCSSYFGLGSYGSNAEIMSTTDRGIGIFASQNYSCGDRVLHECSHWCLISGKKMAHFCFHCHKRINRKAFDRSDAAGINFCSKTCLQKSGQFLDEFSPFLNSILSTNFQFRSEVDIIFLLVTILYNGSLSSIEFWNIQSLLYNCKNNSIYGSFDRFSIEKVAMYIFSYLQMDNCFVLERYSSIFNFPVSVELIGTLLSIVRRNIFSIPIATNVPGTNLIVFLPFLSKLNHCCCPNSLLVVSQDRSSSTESLLPGLSSQGIFIDLICTSTKPTMEGEEFTISYVSSEYFQRERDLFLAEGFGFHCHCVRCQWENDWNTLPLFQSYLMDQENRNIFTKSELRLLESIWNGYHNSQGSSYSGSMMTKSMLLTLITIFQKIIRTLSRTELSSGHLYFYQIAFHILSIKLASNISRDSVSMTLDFYCYYMISLYLSVSSCIYSYKNFEMIRQCLNLSSQIPQKEDVQELLLVINEKYHSIVSILDASTLSS